MSEKVKKNTSLFNLYELVVLQKIRDSKSKKSLKAKPVSSELEVLSDSFGQEIYHLTIKQSLK